MEKTTRNDRTGFAGATLKILHLDDDELYLEQFAAILAKQKDVAAFIVRSVSDLDSYMEALTAMRPDIVVLDINLGADIDGRNVAAATKKQMPGCTVFMCSDHKGPVTVARCFQSGADDFIFKGGDESELAIRLFGAWKLRRPQEPSAVVARSLPKTAGKSMADMGGRIARIVNSAISAVHIRGESGTGKELISEIFEATLPKNTPFIKVNCGAISPTLIESELFGYVKGAFTGANSDRKGLLEDADGGWIFLDEVATLTMPVQVALLRALESGAIRKVGGTQEKKVRFRVLSATNEPIDQMIREGRFRADLWQRLCEATIDLKPLRERFDELEELARHFCKIMTNGPYQLSASAMDLLKAYDWREGNVRELRNCLRAMTELAVDGVLTPLSLPKWFWEKVGDEDEEEREEVGASAAQSAAPSGAGSLTISWEEQGYPSFDAMTSLMLLQLVRNEFGRRGKVSIRQLAKTIGMPKTTLSTRLRNLVNDRFVGMDELSRMVSVGQN
jgi:DNA-binding NtrC family response regulator